LGKTQTDQDGRQTHGEEKAGGGKAEEFHEGEGNGAGDSGLGVQGIKLSKALVISER
jgi:hypothetical protein